jgi:hypothetical protein
MIEHATAQGDHLEWDEIPLVREAFKDNLEESPAAIARGWGRFLTYQLKPCSSAGWPGSSVLQLSNKRMQLAALYI